MNKDTISFVQELNQQFYNQLADDFGLSRNSIWPGFVTLAQLIKAHLPTPVSQLDLGCGNARLGKYLFSQGVVGKYTGVDGSVGLLSQAKIKLEPFKHFQLIKANLFKLDFATLPQAKLVTLIAVLHHVPSYELRLKLIKAAAGQLTTGGLLVVSLWRLGNDKSVIAKQLNHKEVANKFGFKSKLELEADDFLLGFGGSSSQVRYCHHFRDQEIDRLISESGLRLVDEFDADGKSGKLNRYLVLGQHTTINSQHITKFKIQTNPDPTQPSPGIQGEGNRMQVDVSSLVVS